jgi:CubicO group peptidase (beta-lactamase class C family)
MSYCGYGFQLLGEIVRRVSGQSLDAFAAERLFRPLGMHDTSYIVPDALRSRIVRRAPDPSGVEGFGREEEDTPWPDGGVYSTALDMAIFGQMFLNGGSYGDARVLSPASAAAMTRNQIPGISAGFLGQVFPEAEWGLGWSTHGRKNASTFPSLYSASAFEHAGGFGVDMWGDPVYTIVGAYFSAALVAGSPNSPPVWCIDLFTNAVTAAVVDP